MKKVILSMAVVVLVGFTACKNENKQQEGASATTEEVKDMALADVTFGVRGNCSMCKKTIETAALDVAGVKKAVWDVKLKKIDVSFDDSETDEMAIHRAIAASGYDTDQVTGNEEAYGSNPGCCQYDRDMEMNRDTPAKDGHHSHDH